MEERRYMQGKERRKGKERGIIMYTVAKGEKVENFEGVARMRAIA